MLTRLSFSRLWPLVLLLVLAVSVHAEEGKEPIRIDAQDASAHAGEQVIVRMTVNASRLLRDRDIGFLNSKKDYMDEDNFTVVLYERVLGEFADQEIDDPCRHFRGKTIEVSGGVELRRGKPQIVLKSPEDIRIIEEESADDDAA